MFAHLLHHLEKEEKASIEERERESQETGIECKKQVKVGAVGCCLRSSSTFMI